MSKIKVEQKENTMEKSKRGRKKIPDSQKRKSTSFSLPSHQIEFLKLLKHRSEFVENLIENYLSNLKSDKKN